MKTTEDFYATLRVTASADARGIRAAYRRLALEYHPDRNKTLNADQVMRRVNLAYEVLGNSVRRAEYDRARAARRAAPIPKQSVPEQPVGEGRDSGSEWIFVLILIPIIVKAIQRWAA